MIATYKRKILDFSDTFIMYVDKVEVLLSLRLIHFVQHYAALSIVSENCNLGRRNY